MRSGPSTEDFTVGDLSGHVLEPLWQDAEYVLSRTARSDESAPRLVVTPVRATPAAEILSRLQHAHALRDMLDPAWAARPVGLVHRPGRPMLLLEDPGGDLLATLVGSQWELPAFLRVAVGLAVALGRLHARGLVHKDVKPANVLVKVATGDVWLTGFGVASHLPRELQAPGPPDTIAGTLAYMAPEQTGRMNRSIDSRSDLYAFGITLYELLTGAVPFTATDPMELIHCHVARPPSSPATRARGLPEPIAAIVLKLLAKNAEDRYQTAAGVEADLRRCLAAWESAGRIDPFPLARHDVPDQLRLPERLYGREHEVGALLAAFDDVVSAGTPRLVLLSGYAGVGKSSVVHELHAALVPHRGFFASGKFDQYKRDVPCAPVAQALRDLVRSLLGRGETELARWRDAIRAALGDNGQLVVNLVPEVELVIGKQPPVPELPPQDAQSRFHMAIRRFLGVFARREHPVALFLDDLQWLDGATLDLVEHLATHPEVRHLLLVAAYRDNEVGASHPLTRRLQTIRDAGTRMDEVVLAPLALDDVGEMLVDALHCTRGRIRPLAELVHEKTAGNPFFVIQFVMALADERLIAFDRGTATWTWSIGRIQATGYTDNVVDLMIGKLNRLPATTQQALRELACLGHAAPLAVLNAVLGSSDEQSHAALADAVRAGMLLRRDGAYAFLHDRVQEAAYALIPEGERAGTHLRIGRLLAARAAPESTQGAIFDVVNQLNRGVALITTVEEREQLAALNLVAGERAKQACAYASALPYLTAGGALLGDDRWQRRPALAFALELHRAECEFLTGELAAADARLGTLSGRTADAVDAATVTCLRIAVYTVLDEYDRAIAAGLEYLGRLGMTCSPHPSNDEVRQEHERMWRTIGDRQIEALIDLPPMTEPASRATMDVLAAMLSPTLFTDANLNALVLFRMVNVSLERGNCDASCLGYAQLMMTLGPHFGDYSSGARFGQLGFDLVERHDLRSFKARVQLAFGYHVIPWTRHLRVGRAMVRAAFSTAQDSGDLTFAAYASVLLVTNLLASGAPLSEVQREAERGIAFARSTRFDAVVNCLMIQIGLVRALRGDATDVVASHDGPLRQTRDDGQLNTWWYWIRTLQASVFAGDYAAAIDAATRARGFSWSTSSFFEAAEYHFYDALARAAVCDSVPADERARHVEAIVAHHAQLARWADGGPDNFSDRTALIAAEIARLQGRELDAQRLYEDTIRLARTHAFVQNEGLANEIAARFYATRGFETIRDAYLRNARYCYLRWGADGKVRQLDERHPHLRDAPTSALPKATIGATVEQLDLATVVKSSQAMSSEIVLEKLIDTLMVIALEHAGAERGLLILPHGDEQRIEAEATTAGGTVTVRLRGAAMTADDLPESILRYVMRTQENVLLDDATARDPFAADPYVVRKRVRSVLCLPLLKQRTLVGVLYLENNLTPDVFTPARIEVLTLLASQAAISLENAQLYDELHRAEQSLRQHERALRLTVDTIPEMIWSATPDGVVDFFNRRGLDYLGMVSADAGGWGWTSAIHPDDLAVVTETWLEHLRSGEPYENEIRVRRADGQYRWSITRATPLRDETGTIVRWYGSTVDIEDRKQGEETIRQQEQELRLLVDLVPHHILVVDAEWRLLRANQSGMEYLGLTFEQLARNESFDHYHPDDLDGLRLAIESLAQGVPRDFEGRARRHDGQYRWHLFRYVPLHDEHGRVRRWYVTGTDIEDRKHTEERMLEENLALREEVDKVSMFEEIVGTSGPLRDVLSAASMVAPTDSTVLITGETGTGKELFARAIHKRSRRSASAFVSVNCAAVPPPLILSELFGHEKGAFTGALQRRLGRFELADGGTIFLDEIGDLPADAQLALLRVLQERELERVGGTRPIKVNVRVIAATNWDLEAAMASGAFRSDLYYRLNVFPIELPPLRERKEDIPLLVAYFVDRFAGKAGKAIRALDRRTLDILQAYRWPGNVRELQNVIERSIIVCETDTFTVDESWLSREAADGRSTVQPLTTELAARERQMIETALAETRGRVSGPSGAAARLGIPASTLESKIRTLGIAKERFKSL